MSGGENLVFDEICLEIAFGLEAVNADKIIVSEMPGT